MFFKQGMSILEIIDGLGFSRDSSNDIHETVVSVVIVEISIQNSTLFFFRRKIKATSLTFHWDCGMREHLWNSIACLDGGPRI
jgi:hypothetical protein